MTKLYGIAADLVFILHLLFVLAVIFGGFLVWRWPRLAWIHLPIVAWGFTVEVTGMTCPLTPLEKELLVLAGEQGYQGSFIGNYLVPIIYPAGLTPAVRMIFSIAIAAVNIAIYFLLWRNRKPGAD